MEVDGIIEIFKRSVTKYGVKIVKYVGDGNTKTFKNLLEADPYDGDPIVEKMECVLHVKKRMYRHLQTAKKALTQFLKVKKQLEAEEIKKRKAEESSKGENLQKNAGGVILLRAKL